MPKVDVKDLEMALDWVSTDFLMNRAFVNRQTGEILWESDDRGLDEPELPDDIEDETKYVAVPDKRDLDLGATLAMEFIAEALPGDYDEVRQMFRRKGAYRRFKELLEQRDVVQRWYDYRDQRVREALEEWCRDHGFEPEG